MEEINKKEFEDFQRWKKAKDNADAVDEKSISEKLTLVDNPDTSKMEDEKPKPEEKDEWVCEECNANLGTADNPPKFCSECGSELIEK